MEDEFASEQPALPPALPAQLQPEAIAADPVAAEAPAAKAVDLSNPKRLGEMLVQKGLVSGDQIEIALVEMEGGRTKDKMLGPVLISLGFITEGALSDVLAESSGVKTVDLKSVILESSLIKTIPKDIALKYKVLALSKTDDGVVVAMSDIYNIVAIDQVRRCFSRNTKVIPTYAPETQILETIDQHYDFEMSIDGILKELEALSSKGAVEVSKDSNYTNPAVRLVDVLLVDGVKAGASDIHFEPEEAFIRLRYRIDGALRQIRSFHKRYWSSVVVRLKIISGMNIAESRHPQDGRITLQVLGREVDFRVATHPTIHGENVVMRILDRKQSLVPLAQLGISKHNEDLLLKMLQRPEGIIIVTGPTGSGKTTTLYSVLNYINDIDSNIMTLEDPVEYQLAMIRQTSVKEGSGISFTDGIKSMMRQDPDIIFVGEVRDLDTATMAVRAAMTGHQVFTTLHTNDAYGAIPRLIDIGVLPTMLAGSLICIVAQRLLRKLCLLCREEWIPDTRACKILKIDQATAPKLFHAKGCPECSNTGYRGRVAVCEILPIDRNMDEMIASGASRRVVIEYAVAQGFRSMLDDGAEKVLMGITDVDALADSVDVTSRI